MSNENISSQNLQTTCITSSLQKHSTILCSITIILIHNISSHHHVTGGRKTILSLKLSNVKLLNCTSSLHMHSTILCSISHDNNNYPRLVKALPITICSCSFVKVFNCCVTLYATTSNIGPRWLCRSHLHVLIHCGK